MNGERPFTLFSNILQSKMLLQEAVVVAMTQCFAVGVVFRVRYELDICWTRRRQTVF